MTDEYGLEANPDPPMVYHIRIRGHLVQQRLAWFDGLTCTLEDDGNTLLTGSVIDQAALHGILKKIRDLGMPLLSVNSVGSVPDDRADTKDQQAGDS